MATLSIVEHSNCEGFFKKVSIFKMEKKLPSSWRRMNWQCGQFRKYNQRTCSVMFHFYTWWNLAILTKPFPFNCMIWGCLLN